MALFHADVQMHRSWNGRSSAFWIMYTHFCSFCPFGNTKGSFWATGNDVKTMCFQYGLDIRDALLNNQLTSMFSIIWVDTKAQSYQGMSSASLGVFGERQYLLVIGSQADLVHHCCYSPVHHSRESVHTGGTRLGVLGYRDIPRGHLWLVWTLECPRQPWAEPSQQGGGIIRMPSLYDKLWRCCWTDQPQSTARAGFSGLIRAADWLHLANEAPPQD